MLVLQSLLGCPNCLQATLASSNSSEQNGDQVPFRQYCKIPSSNVLPDWTLTSPLVH